MSFHKRSPIIRGTSYEKGLHFQNLIFQQDDASVYKEKIVIKVFEEEEREVLEWWANSPNVNPIEILWQLQSIGIVTLLL